MRIMEARIKNTHIAPLPNGPTDKDEELVLVKAHELAISLQDISCHPIIPIKAKSSLSSCRRTNGHPDCIGLGTIPE